MNPFMPISIGDIAKIAELLVALIGFSVTIHAILRSKSAAERAVEAANRAREAIIRSQTLTEFASAITTMNEIKRLHRVEAWELLPERYAALRAMLISVRSSNSDLPEDQRATIQGAIKHFNDFEVTVERSISSKKPLPNPARLNAILSEQIDKLTEILAAIKQQKEK